MADEPPLTVVPLSRGIRKSRPYEDPFISSVGEALDANCGVFTLEGGIRQHGGITQYTGAAAGGAIVWMKRWYKSDGTKYFLALSDDGVLSLVSDSLPATLTTIYSGLSGVPFTSAELNDWLYLSNGVDPFLRYDGTDIVSVGAEPQSITGVSIAEVSGGGSIEAGTYMATFTTEYGEEGVLGESNPASGGILSTTVSANAAITISNLPVSSRSDATYKSVYLTLKDGDVFYWRERIPMSQTSVTISEGDSLLTLANYQLEEDHDVPPRLKHLAVHKGRIFGEDPTVPGRIRFDSVIGSDVFPDNPVFYSDELAQEGEDVVSLFRLGESLFGAKKTTLWILTGESNEQFIWDEVPQGRGFVAEQSVRRGDGVVFGVGARDLQMFDGFRTYSLEHIRGFLDLVDDVNKSSAYGVYRDKKYYVALKTGSDTRRALVLVIHTDPLPGVEERISPAVSKIELSYGASSKFEVGSFAVWSNENERIFIGGYDGYIYEFDVGLNWNRVGEDEQGANFVWQSNWIWGQNPAQFERYEKAYVMVQSVGGEITLNYDIMTDDPNSLSSGSQTIDLNPTVDDDALRVARWNISRWG